MSSNVFIQVMAKAMRPKFDKYWGTCYPNLAISSIVDPQYKMKLLDYYFPMVYGPVAASEIIDDVKDSFGTLYNEYASNSPSNDHLSCQRVCDGERNTEVSEFDHFIQATTVTHATKRDIDYYLEEPVLPRANNFDVLTWWKVNEGKYPILSKIARDILAVPVSTVASESVFSTGGRVLDKYRSRLKPHTAQGLICGQDWLRDEFIGTYIFLYLYARLLCMY